MNIVNLYEYISNWAFLENIRENNPFDVIITDEGCNIESDYAKVIKLEDIKESNIQWALAHYTQDNNVLLVLTSLTVDHIYPLLKTPNINLTIINLWVGITGFSSKSYPEINDITPLLNFGYKVYEPADLVGFIKLLTTEGNKYFRVTQFGLPGKIDDGCECDHKCDDCEKDDTVISFTKTGYEWGDATVLVAGASIAQTMQALKILSQHLFNADMFGIADLNFDMNKEIQDSLQKTERLIVVVDQQASTLYEDIIKAKLLDKGLYTVEVDFVYPDYGKLTTIMPEYMPDQAKFDQMGIAEQIGLFAAADNN